MSVVLINFLFIFYLFYLNDLDKIADLILKSDFEK